MKRGPWILRSQVCAWSMLVIAFAGSVGAADAPGNDSQDRGPLEDLIQEGIRLRRSGNDEAALEVFHKAERRSPDSVRVLLQIATAAQAAGKWLECDAYLRKVGTHRDDAYFQRHRAAITAIETAIAKRVGRFSAVGTPEGAEVRLNGELIGNLNMDQPQSVEAGTYVLDVYHPGYYRVRRSITIQGGMLSREAVDLNELPAPTPQAARSAGGAEVSFPQSANVVGGSGSAGSSAPAQDREKPYPGRWITWTLAGLSVAAAGTSAVSFVLREQHASRWNDDARCLVGDATREQTCSNERDAAERWQRIGIISGAAAVVLGAGAVVHLLTTGNSSAHSADGGAPERKVSHSLACGAGFMSVACQGTF